MAALSQYEFEKVQALLQEHFLRPLQSRLAQAENALIAVAQQLEALPTTTEHPLSERLELRRQLLALAHTQLPPFSPQPLEHFFPGLQQQLAKFIEEQEPIRTELQQEARFLPQQDDPAWLRSLKFWKRNLRRLSAKRGLLLSLLAKQAPAGGPSAWTHQIPWQRLLRRHLQLHLLHRLQEAINIASRHQLELLQAASALSLLPDRQPQPSRSEMLQEIRQRLQQAQAIRKHADELLQRQLETATGRFYIELEKDYAKAGTIELPAAALRHTRLQKEVQARLDKVEEQLNSWKNAQLCTSSQWSLLLHVHQVADGLRQHQQQGRHAWLEKLQNGLAPAFEAIAGSLRSFKQQLVTTPLPDAFTQVREQLQNQLAQTHLAAAAGQLTELKLPAMVQNLEGPFQELLASLPEQCTLSQLPGGKEISPQSPAQLVTFSPRELAGLELLPQTVRTLAQKRNEVQQQLEEIRHRLGELHEAGLYKLTDAQAHWEQHPQEEEKARSLALAGIDQTQDQLNTLADRLQQLSNSTWQELEQLVQQLTDRLLQLSQAETAQSLQQQLQRTKSRRHKAAQAARHQPQSSLHRLQQRIRLGLQKANLEQQRFWAQLSLDDTPSSSTATTDLPHYLAEKEQARQRLPFVYQRLFADTPLTDELLLVGRTAEWQALQQGWQRYQAGDFSSVLLVGERGSGTTSLLSLFLKKYMHEHRVVRLPLQASVPDAAALASLLTHPLGLPPNSSWQTLQAILQQQTSPLVIVVEDLQYLFRRWVGGLEPIKTFLELVAASSRQVFWLCSCSLYAWCYLQRALDGSSAWSRVIPLHPLTASECRELIMRRHLFSGYQLHYEPGPQHLADPRYKALPADEKQTFLEEALFRTMQAFAQGSVRLALQYWQWCTLAVSTSTITLTSALPTQPQPLYLLDTPSYFILQALLLHEQLSPSELSRMLRESEDHCRRQLLLLHNQGVVLLADDRYTLNPLLYRQLVNHLKHLNLLH